MTAPELARYFGCSHLYDILSPVIHCVIPHEVLRSLQEQFHNLLRDELSPQVVNELHIRLPQLEFLTEQKGDLMWFPLSEHKFPNAVSPESHSSGDS